MGPALEPVRTRAGESSAKLQWKRNEAVNNNTDLQVKSRDADKCDRGRVSLSKLRDKDIIKTKGTAEETAIQGRKHELNEVHQL